MFRSVRQATPIATGQILTSGSSFA
jgi:hypothetical protein